MAELSWVRRCDDDLSMEELNAWAQRAEQRGRLPATARAGSLTAAPLVTPQGALSHQPAAVSSGVELDSGRHYPPHLFFMSTILVSIFSMCPGHDWRSTWLSLQGSCAEAVLAACPGTTGEQCIKCVRK